MLKIKKKEYLFNLKYLNNQKFYLIIFKNKNK